MEQESNTITFLLQELRKHIEQKHLSDNLPTATYLSLVGEEDSKNDLPEVQLGSICEMNEKETTTNADDDCI